MGTFNRNKYHSVMRSRAKEMLFETNKHSEPSAVSNESESNEKGWQ